MATNPNVTIITETKTKLQIWISNHPPTNLDTLVAAVNSALATATANNPAGIDAAITSAVQNLVAASDADQDLSADGAALDAAIAAFTATGATIDAGLAAAVTAFDAALVGPVDTPETTAAVADLKTFVDTNFS